MIRIEHDEDRRQRAFLDMAPGEPGSGRVRYAAAMHFFQRGMLSRRALEIYRIAAKLDHEDPREALARQGHAIELTGGEAGALAIAGLVDAVDGYLAAFEGDGVRAVRDGLSRNRDGFIRPRHAGRPAVVDEHLEPALRHLAAGGQSPLADAIRDAASCLVWHTYDGYDPERIGAAFRDGHAYASIIGESAAIPGEDYDLGLFLIAPHVFYRDHRHKAPELYAPLTGPHGWRFGPGEPLEWLPAHTPVWNEPFRPHATKVGAVPFLCIFGWTRDVAEPATVIAADDWPQIEAMRETPP